MQCWPDTVSWNVTVRISGDIIDITVASSVPPLVQDTGEMAVVRAAVLATLLAASCTSLRIRRDAACDEVMAAFDTCTEA